MNTTRCAALAFSLALLGATTEAQYSRIQIFDDEPPVLGFIDLSSNPALAIPGVMDDSAHAIMTTVTNFLWPAGPALVGNNGGIIAGLNAGGIGTSNQPIPAFGPPFGPSPNPQVSAGGTTYLFPFWDDLLPRANLAPSNTTIYVTEVTINLVTVLVIQWKNETHFVIANDNNTVSFEVQIFQNPAFCDPLVQFLYQDTYFGSGISQFGFPLVFLNEGADATIGVASTLGNAQWSFNEHAVTFNSCLSIHFNAAVLTATSPFGPGSLFINSFPITCGGDSHVLAVTQHAGAFPNGFLFGLDIPIPELLNELAIGPPFTGQGSNFSLGPFTGLPNLTFFAVALELKQGALFGGSSAIMYTIP